MSSNKLATNPFPTKQIARIATLAIVGIAYFFIAVSALHFLRPEYNPLSRFVSEYAVGPYAFFMTTAFFGLSLGSLALVIGLYQGVSRTGRSWTGLFFLGIWGIGMLIAGIFPTDLLGAAKTTTGHIHDLAAVLAFFSLTIASFLLAWRYKQDEKWSSFRRLALILSVLLLLALIGFILSVNTTYVGLGQRIFISMCVIWLLLTAVRLRHVATESVAK